MDDLELDRIKIRKMMEMMRGREPGGKVNVSGGHPVVVNDSNFDELIRSNTMVIVDFWADWCMPCRMLAPIVEELASELRGKAVVGKLNVDENPVSASKYGIMSIPTLMIFKDGRPVDAIIGVTSKSNILKKINKYLS
ncbi:MAG: thioredoxin [Aigarchaeota archaeon]|nr:thioredoxin [Aigarchaeota archaeon]MDW8092677.1 thioredoxin [Nitrososphaerota archaeon]